MTPEIVDTLLRARVPLVEHMPILCVGTNVAGEARHIPGIILGRAGKDCGDGVWLASVACSPGPERIRLGPQGWERGGRADVGWEWDPWWLTPLVAIDHRTGFLLACDEADRRGIISVSMGFKSSVALDDLRSLSYWTPSRWRPIICRALATELAAAQ